MTTRFEVTGTANDVFGLAAIKAALRSAGASRVNQRRALGWRNQPLVATFSAEGQDAADAVCAKARELLDRPGGLPALLAFPY